MQRRESKTLKRFSISFLCVLILPVVFFVYLNMNDFKEIYQHKIMEQMENTVAVTAKELDRYIETLYDIATYNSRLPHFQSYAVVKDITGKDIMSSLDAEEAVHSVMDHIYYCNPLKNGRLYTSNGTYTLHYYARLVAGIRGKEELLAEWNSLGGDGWMRWQEKNNQGKEERVLQYVIRMRDGGLWIFTFSSKELEKILGGEDVVTILTDRSGEQLYISGYEAESWENCYEISVESQNGYFKLVRLISEENLFSEVTSWQKRFWGMVVIVLAAGFLLVLFLTWYNEYPIRKLQKYCVEKVHNIPKNLSGMEIFLFAFQNIEEKAVLLEQKQNRERLLLQLLLDVQCDTEDFRKKLHEAGIFTHAKYYRVIIAALQREDNCPKLELCMELEVKEYEIYSLDILTSNVIVMLVGMTLQDDEMLESKLQRVTEKIRDTIQDEVQFYFGSSCDSLKGIQPSYMQAVMGWQGRDEDLSQGQEIPNRYPSDALKLLYDALVEIDFEKASMITDVLIEMLKRHCDNEFLCASLYYDVFNAYYNACAKLEANGSIGPLDLEFFEIQGAGNMVQMIRKIRERFRLYIGECSEEKSEKNIIPRVTAYIDENITNYELSVGMLADYFNISISNLSHQFKAQMNCTVSGYITDKRFAYAGELLVETDYTVNAIAELLGYSQARSFIRKFRQYYGMTPIEYRNKYGISQ